MSILGNCIENTTTQGQKIVQFHEIFALFFCFLAHCVYVVKEEMCFIELLLHSLIFRVIWGREKNKEIKKYHFHIENSFQIKKYL